MADAAKDKAEKLAAAKKRVEALKKQKAKKGGSKKDETLETSVEALKAEEASAVEAINDEAQSPEADATEVPEKEEKKDSIDDTSPSLQRNPSLSLQSKMRSSSFRQNPGSALQSPSVPITPGFGPDGDTASSIYLKQAARIDDLEKENKRLAKEATDGERRYKKAEEELEVLREAESEAPAQNGSAGEDVEKLKTEIAALQRQNTQLQAKTSRHGSSPSMSVLPPSSLAAELESKSATIESMELEISNLRAQITRISSGTSASQEQITALEEKLLRSQKASDLAQQELSDIKKNLERTTEKALKEGSERISAETKLLSLKRASEASQTEINTLNQKISALEKKIQTLTNLHKEHDTRHQTQRKEKEKIEKEAAEMRTRLTSLENENLRLREEKERIKKKQAEGIDDEGLDELEDEERLRMAKKIRDLEAEVFELRRGVWKEKRSAIMDGNPVSEGFDSPNYNITSPGGFSNVDLGGVNSGLGGPYTRGRSGTNHASGKSVGQFISSGFSAIAGNITGLAGEEDNEGFLDDDMDFDEDAFRIAQEEEMKKRIERVKETKRKLREWSGWRLDLVENRKGGGGEGAGEIFEI